MATTVKVGTKFGGTRVAVGTKYPPAGAAAPPAGAVLWLKADSLVGADGSTVSAWADSSGSGSDPTTITNVVLKTGANGLNGLNVAKFNGSTSVMFGSFSPGSTGLTVAYVARVATRDLYGSILSTAGSPTATTGATFSMACGTDANQGAGYGGTTANVFFGAVVGSADNTAYFASYVYNRTQWQLDGLNTTVVSDTAWPTGAFNYAVGHDRVSAPVHSWFNGDIAEVIVYASALGATDLATLKSYLKSKWSV